MPTVKDKQTGDVVSKQPYTAEGTQRAEQIAESDPNWEITNAPDNRENYQLGGLIPGQPGFGERPSVIAPRALPNNPMWETTTTTPTPNFEEGGKVDEYKRGGKARRKARREARQEKRNLRKVSKLQKKGVKVKTTAKTLEDVKKLKPTGKIRAGAKEVTVTKGGAYAAYGKKSVAAKSFRKAYSSAKKGSTFSWDGRKYKKD